MKDTCNKERPCNKDTGAETIQIEKTKAVCALCEENSTKKAKQKDLVAIISCEGACLRGEISRRVANHLCFNDFPEKTFRVCLGGAFTKDTGQRNVVRTAHRVVVLEGCVIECASRMMKGVIPALNPEIVIVDRQYAFETSLFGINEVSENNLADFTSQAVQQIKTIINIK